MNRALPLALLLLAAVFHPAPGAAQTPPTASSGGETGGTDGTVDSSAQRTAMLASMLAAPQRAPLASGQDPFANAAAPKVGAAPAPRERAGELVGSAAAKIRAGDYPGGLRDALEAASLDPASAAAYLKAAEASNHLGRFPDAETQARASAALDANNALAWKNLAWALLKQAKSKDALDAALGAAKINPGLAEAWAIAGFSAEKLNDPASRLSYLQKAAALDPRFQARLDAVNAGGLAYADDASAEDAPAAAPEKSRSIPLPAALGGLAALAIFALALSAFATRRRRPAAEVVAPVAAAASSPKAFHAPRMEAPSGGLVIGKYELGQIIGRGGMGEVYEAKDLSLGRSVAIKKMTAGFEELGEQARGLFIKEARTVAQLHHPAIVDIYEILEQGKDLYLVFEHVKGKTTQQLLAETGRLPLKRAAEVLKPVCEALQFAHGRAMVHRDLKPANIMITEQGHVKLMDFGIARSLRDAVETQLGVRAVATAAVGSARTATVVGTPVYMAPEAELGVVCKEGDVYALGVTLFELVTGRLPFSTHAMATEKATLGFAKATTLAEGLPAAVDALIEDALQPLVEHRLKTPAEFMSRLGAAAR